MANTIQKKIKFSKGQVVPELVERTDLSLLDSSAQELKNLVSTIYGGIRSRRGTKYIDYITSINEKKPSSITSDFTSDTSHFTDTSPVKFNKIGSSRTIAQIDYGETENGACRLQLKDIKLVPYSLELKTAQTKSIDLSSGEYNITISGASGGRRYGGESSGTNSAYYTSGGSGGGFNGVLRLSAGTYPTVVGSAGFGTGNGGASSFGSLITAGGGQGSSGTGNSEGWHAGSPVIGNGGSISVSGTVVSSSIRSSGNKGSARIDNGSHIRTAPEVPSVLSSIGISNGGVPSFTYGTSDYHNGYDLYGTDGYFKITQKNPKGSVVISVSENGTDYEVVSRTVLSSTPSDIVVSLNKNYRYVRIVLEDESGESLVHGLSFSYIRNDVSSADSIGKYGVRLLDFVYNDTDKHLICLTENTIQIFKEDTVIRILENTGITKNHLPELKWAVKDDTIVFTHKDLKPKILKRLNTGDWSFGDLEWENVPYAVFGEEKKEKKTVGITPSELEGAVKITAESSVFTKDWVGQYIDGNGGRVKISEYVSETVVNGHTVIPFYTKDKITSWDYISGYEPVWSSTRGYPRTCCFAQQRLWFGGSAQKPTSIWASRLGDYFNFKNSGNYDNDAIDVEIVTNDPIVNLVENRGLHIFTTGQEMSVSEGNYTPDGFSVAINTHNGSLSNVSPKILGNGILVFIEKNGKSLLSYVYDYNQSSYTTDNLSMLSSLVEAPIALATDRNSSVDKGDFLYLVLDNGKMLINCLELNQNINSCSVFETKGNIIDVCCLREDVYILVNRNNTICLEKIVENTVDCEKTFSIVVGEISGLFMYEGQYVYIKLENGEIIKKKVNNYSVGLKNIKDQTCSVGLAYEYRIVGNPIAINNQTTSVKKRIATAEINCKDTPVLTFCGQKKEGKDNYKFYMCTKYGSDTTYEITGEYYPMKILSIQLNINYEG